MQGGHPDGINPGIFDTCKTDGSKVKNRNKTKSNVSKPESAPDPQPLTLLGNMRRLFVLAWSLPMAWLTLHPSVEAFKAHKARRVLEGTATVLKVQEFRNAFLDVYFQTWSFCAEEEFYLIVLPFLFWNVDVTLARRLTFVVCGGLIFGNVYKDAFQLPRPRSPPVWCPSAAAYMDSTNCRDFGFPSTHAMNAISNSLFVLLYFYAGGRQDGTVCGFDISTALLLAAVWQVSIIVGRLYLGVHTPTDLRGGLAIGLWTALIWHMISNAFEYIIVNDESGPYGGFGSSVATVLSVTLIMVLHPQPRPTTPTFVQNSLLLGLCSGCMHGSRLWYLGSPEIGLPPLSLTEPPLSPLVSGSVSQSALRLVVGYAVVLILRQTVKTVLSMGFKLIGVNASAGGKSSHPLDRDLIGATVTKLLTYHSLAFAITYAVPLVFDRINLAHGGTVLEHNPSPSWNFF